MAEFTSTKLDPDTHLLLDQPLLRVPNELLRRKLKSAQRQIEITSKNMNATMRSNTTQAPSETLAILDATLAKAQNLKRKLEALQTEEKVLHVQQKARIQHMQQLHDIPNLADVKYDRWSQTRLDRLLVDYLLRQGYTKSAKELAREKRIEDLVDLTLFEECGKIEQSLREGRMQECLTWCMENKQALKKMNSNLELELRLQQFIELARGGETQQVVEAIIHARKHLAAGQDNAFVLQAGGLLAHRPDTPVERYRTLYGRDRYAMLANQFIKTHHELVSLPSQPLLHIALSAGLSALKTPSCHSIHTLASSTVTGAPACPICSSELKELALNLPYAHHTKSYIEDDPIVLPNGRVFGREWLRALNDKLGTEPGRVKDPSEPESAEWAESELKKVFIS